MFGLTVLAFASTGCGSREFDVAGKVTYNGAPLDKSGGVIVFVGPSGNQVVADINLDGTYRATDVSVGPNQVVVYYTNPRASKGIGAAAKLANKQSAAMPKHPNSPPSNTYFSPPAEPMFLTPAKYAVVETSGISVVVQGPTTFDVDLSGPKIP